MAVDRVRKLLHKVTRALDRAKIPYAVVGGNAVAAWVATVDEEAIRFTKDVDLLVPRDVIGRMTETLGAINLMPVEVMGVWMFVDRRRPSPKSGVHLVIANEKVRSHYRHPAPDLSDAVRTKAGYMVIDLRSLVEMKLQSFRPVDQTHLIDMVSVGLIDAKLKRRLPPDLRRRLSQIEPHLGDIG